MQTWGEIVAVRLLAVVSYLLLFLWADVAPTPSLSPPNRHSAGIFWGFFVLVLSDFSEALFLFGFSRFNCDGR